MTPAARVNSERAKRCKTILFFFLVALAWVYSLLAIMAALRYATVRPPALHSPSPMSVLKPLAGHQEELEDNLRTFFEQDYPAFELVFAVRTVHDPAVTVVERLKLEYPHIPTRLIVTGEPTYANAKVYSLERMLSEAANDLIVMSDSDVRAGPDLLRTVSAEFQDSQLGLTTCPYRAVAGASLWSRMEAVGMNTDFMAGILVARMIKGMRFAVGPTIVARRSVLQSIGAFDKVKDYLAEDFLMGKLVAAAGYGVALSSYVIEHHIGNSTLRQNVEHRLRWVRSTRRSRRWAYPGLFLTMPLPLALLACAAHPGWWPLLPFILVVRYVAAYVVSVRVLKAKVPWWLLLIEDLAGFFFWAAGFFGNTIVWQGQQYRLYSNGRFELLPSLRQAFPHHSASAGR